MTKTSVQRKGSGLRRRFAGKTGVRVKVKGGWSVTPRAHTHGGKSQADAGWTTYNCPAAKGRPPGRYKVNGPTKRWQRHGIVRNATTGEITDGL